MSIPISIGSTVIDFPSSAESPNWAEPIIEFAQAVESNLNSVLGAGDVLPNTFSFDALNGAVLTSIPGFTLDTVIVQGSLISYTVKRQRDTTTLVEYGSIQCIYNPNGTATQKWSLSREYVGEAQVGFDITDLGQVQISTEVLSGTGAHTGLLSFSAKSILNS